MIRECYSQIRDDVQEFAMNSYLKPMGLVPLFYALCLVLVVAGCNEVPKATNVAPTLEITNPINNTTFSPGEEISIVADARDTDGTIESVVFFVEDEQKSVVTRSPFSYNFSAAEAGSYALSAQAYDNSGANSPRRSVNITVGEPPVGTALLKVEVEGTGTVTSQPTGINCPSLCTKVIRLGQSVTLIAEPSEDFEGWQGCSSASNTCTVEVSRAKTVTANFEGEATSVSLSPTQVTLSPGATQSFTATVTPSGSVTWSSTGGSLVENDLQATFTAPATVGTYTVSASSVTDPSQKATATIEVKTSGLSEAFSIIALPDTQNYTCVGNDGDGCGNNSSIYKDNFIAQTQWIVDNLDREKIAFVTHLGDVVDNGTRTIEWEYADDAMDILDGKVPYSVAMGDHDFYPEEHQDGDTLFPDYFGKNRYRNYSWYGGSDDQEYNHYQIVEMGGLTFLHIALVFEAPSASLAWAKSIMETYPTTPTIISTHAYLADGSSPGRSTTTESCANLPGSGCPDPGNATDASSGEDIFQALVKPYPQVFMVLNGHYHFNGRTNTDCNDGIFACDNGEYRQVSTNSAGSKVYEMLANYQDYDEGGDGWLRIIKFLPGGGANGLDRIEVRTYSPTLNRTQSGFASMFFYDLSFAERFDLGE